MGEFSKFLVVDGAVSCPRNAYPVALDRCYRCRYLRDQQETLRGDDVICCDYIEVAAELEISRLMGAAPG